MGTNGQNTGMKAGSELPAIISQVRVRAKSRERNSDVGVVDMGLVW